MRSWRKRERIRADLEWLRSQYDSGAICDAVYTPIKNLETNIAWSDHWQSLGKAAGRVVKKLDTFR